ncbi:MAG TPA: glycoside hydrolase family 3 N-terminal domain-containing protein [Gaiellaceae bacterium]|nr:glycoside hydrolase family 3 N-terminal domain-containing protein [Gaiellaceae bacterium]
MNELAAACLLPSFPGSVPPDWAKRFVAAGGRGFVLFSYNLESLPELVAALRAERHDLLLAIDEEGGDVTRLGTSQPGAAALGAVDDAAVTEAVAGSIAAELVAAGLNWNLAPVADVNVPENPVIGTRAFGDEPELVARHVAAYVRGTQALGVAACAKHFPGHGSTREDSHLALPELVGDVEDGLPPFRAAIDAGVRSVMTAHIKVRDVPATIDRSILTGLLREELGFDGVIVADALEMKGLSAFAGIEDGAVRAVEAGADALIVGHDLHEDAVEKLGTALLRVDGGRLGEAASRVDALAAWARPRDVARRALLVEGDVRGARSIVELRPVANIAAGEAEHRLGAAQIVREGEPVPPADVYVVRDAHRHAWMRDAADVEGSVVVELGLPVWRPSRARGYIATYGGGRAALEAAAEVLR